MGSAVPMHITYCDELEKKIGMTASKLKEMFLEFIRY